MAERVTLQNRITTFMVILTIVIIAAFTAIQVYNQLNTITLHNQFRARLGTIIAKNNFESVLQGEETPQEQSEYLKHTVSSLTESQIIDSIEIYDPKCKLIAASDPTISRRSALRPDAACINDAMKATQSQKWFYPRAQKRILDIFLPLSSKGDYKYVAKLTFSLGNMIDALRQVYIPCIFTAIVVIGMNTGLGYFLARTVIGPIKTLDSATQIIADGDLNHRVDVKTGDELEDLATRFNNMTIALIKMKDRAENANPLTKLPGNIVIREEAEKRIQEDKKFTVIYCDLDNFKAFNDKYGIEKGDQAIKLTADVFKEAVKEKGGADDFVGHEGGDDFILLTTPERSQGIADYITKEFDKRVIAFYSDEDRQKGYIEAKSRQGVLSRFPIMSISLAGVTNQFKAITSYAEITNIAAELKKKAKSIEGSVFVLDKRTDERSA